MEPNDPGVLYNCTCLHARMNKADEAINFLKKAISCGFSAKVWIESDPDLDSIRQHPEYDSVLKSISS